MDLLIEKLHSRASLLPLELVRLGGIRISGGNNSGTIDLPHTIDFVTQAARCLRCNEPNCVGGCPLGIGIPAVLSLVSAMRLQEAAALVRERDPLAAITGRICPSDRFCQRSCLLGRKQTPVALLPIERFLGNISLNLPIESGKTYRGRVLVVGSGPAGLTAAHDLCVDGFTVTVQERKEELGGCLRTIPQRLLPSCILKKELERLTKSPITFELGKECHYSDRILRNFDFVIIATGEPKASINHQVPPFLVKTDAEGLIVVDDHAATSRASVFAAGGSVGCYGSITEAMASGRLAAQGAARRYLIPL